MYQIEISICGGENQGSIFKNREYVISQLHFFLGRSILGARSAFHKLALALRLRLSFLALPFPSSLHPIHLVSRPFPPIPLLTRFPSFMNPEPWRHLLFPKWRSDENRRRKELRNGRVSIKGQERPVKRKRDYLLRNDSVCVAIVWPTLGRERKQTQSSAGSQCKQIYSV